MSNSATVVIPANPDAETGKSTSDVQFTFLGKLVEVPVSDVVVTNRLRPVDPIIVEGIAASVKRDGLLSPIDICQLPGRSDYLLVCGGHRLAALQMLGWATIPAFIRSANALERRSREIIENIMRAPVAPLDEARFVTELLEVEKARMGIAPDRDGRANNSRKPSKKDVADDLRILSKSIPGLQGSVAEKLGLSQQEVSRKLALNAIAPSFLDRVRKLPIASNASALRQLAKLHWMEQDDVLTRLEGGQAKDIGTAIAQTKNTTPPDPEKKRLGAFIGAFERMGRRERMAALMALASMMPKGVRIDFESGSDQVQAATDAARLSGRGAAGVVGEAAE